MFTGVSLGHVLIVFAVSVIVIGLDIYVLVRLARLGEGLTGRVVFWGLLTLLVPLIGALAVLFALGTDRLAPPSRPGSSETRS